MRLIGGQPSVLHGRSLFGMLERAFPTPKLLLPLSAGVDISDSSVKWLAIEKTSAGKRIRSFGSLPLPPGVVEGGIIKDMDALVETLRELKAPLSGIEYIHAALPEEAAYVFSMAVPQGSTREQSLRMIEFELQERVPIPADAAVYDYDPIHERGKEESGEIGVVVFPRELAESYAAAFERAGLTLLSLEIEARSIARAVSSGDEKEPITLIVDFGRARTGFTVVKRGIPIFTSTVDVGGNAVTRAVKETLSLSDEDVETFKNEQGLEPDSSHKPADAQAVIGAASALADEVARHYHYWDTRRNEKGEQVTPVGRVVLVGGSSNLRGLAAYIAGRIQAPTELANTWRNVFSFDEYIPPIHFHISLEYATCAGLALRGM